MDWIMIPAFATMETTGKAAVESDLLVQYYSPGSYQFSVTIVRRIANCRDCSKRKRCRKLACYYGNSQGGTETAAVVCHYGGDTMHGNRGVEKRTSLNEEKIIFTLVKFNKTRHYAC
jgi:hypothetical protein